MYSENEIDIANLFSKHINSIFDSELVGFDPVFLPHICSSIFIVIKTSTLVMWIVIYLCYAMLNSLVLTVSLEILFSL